MPARPFENEFVSPPRSPRRSSPSTVATGTPGACHRSAASNFGNFGAAGLGEDGERTADPVAARSEATLEAALQSSLDPTHVVDRDLHLTAFNEAYRVQTLTALGCEPHVGMNVSRLVSDDARKAWIARYNRALLGHAVRFDHRAPLADGTEATFEVQLTPIRLPDGIAGAVTVCRDATERLRLLDRFRDLEASQQSMVEHATDIVTVIAADDSIRYASPSVERLLGWTPDELRHHGGLMLVHPDDVAEVRSALREATATPEAPAALRYRFRHRTEGWRTLEATVRGRRQPDGETLAIVNSRDVSEQETLESHLRQRERVASIGRLAGGVAHEFRNLLTTILGHAGDTDHSRDPGVAARAICLAAERGQELLRQLESFAGAPSGEKHSFVAGAVLGQLDFMLSRLLGDDIRVVSHVRDGDWAIRMSEGLFEQVVVNFALAARAVMPRGGRLTIETATVHLEEEIAEHVPPIPAGEYVSLSVLDEGPTTLDDAKHASAEIIEALEGLEISRAIVRRAGGFLWAYRESGRGSCHRAYFPRHRDAASPAPAQDNCGALVGGSESILVVEDDPSVRSLAVRTLRAHGYSVLEAVNGQDALSVARAHVGALELVVTDLVMPQLGGPEMLFALRSRRPKLRAVLMSGYTASAVDDAERQVLGARFLEKPFTQAALLRTVRAELDLRPL